MCGLPCSGKTTRARQLEVEHRALWLSPDVWMARIVRDGWDAERRAAIEAVQLDIAVRVLELGHDVILEGGFWHLAERLHARDCAGRVGASCQVHFLDAPLEVLIQRAQARAADCPPDTFVVTADNLTEWYNLIERPLADELTGLVP